MPEKHKPRTASYLILEKGNEVLLMKRKNTGFKDGNYSLIAGHVDEGENFREAMIREAEEEVDIGIKKENLETVSIMHRRSEGNVYVDIFFKAGNWEGEPTNKEPEKCEELRWVRKNDLPENTIGYVKRAINEMDDGLEYQEIGWD
ncbi:MAG: NUDIX hydrolase [Nanohaloarchaea archaeon SW_7_43_1]|nr:MAG: NUDIX hydrolase [Nanohaloarchaea archaeon SW_7_43_1]